MNKKLNFVLIAVFLFVWSACQKNENTFTPSQEVTKVESNLISVKNGRLAFQNIDAFEKSMENLNNEQSSIVKQFKNFNSEGFISLNQREELKDSNTEDTLNIKNIIPDKQLIQVLNNNLELQIGEYIYRIGGNECIYIYKQKNAADVNEFAKNQKENLKHLASTMEIKDNKYTISPSFSIYYPKESLYQKNTSYLYLEETEDEKNLKTQEEYIGRIRFTVTTWTYKFIWYASCGCNARLERRKNGFLGLWKYWGDHDANIISLKWENVRWHLNDSKKKIGPPVVMMKDEIDGYIRRYRTDEIDKKFHYMHRFPIAHLGYIFQTGVITGKVWYDSYRKYKILTHRVGID